MFLYFLYGPTVIGYTILVSLPSVITTHFMSFFNFWYLKCMKSTCYFKIRISTEDRAVNLKFRCQVKIPEQLLEDRVTFREVKLRWLGGSPVVVRVRFIF